MPWATDAPSRRLLAYAIDLVWLSVCLDQAADGYDALTTRFLAQPPVSPDSGVTLTPAQLQIWLFGVLATSLIGWALEAAWLASPLGATPGKWLVGLRVVRLDGGRAGFWRAILRSASRLASGVIGGAGFMQIVWRTDRRALHDEIAGTRVIARRDKIAGMS